MATIKIINGASGSFPAQKAMLIMDRLTVKTSMRDERVYSIKNSIVSLSIASEHKGSVVFDIRLADGACFRGEANKKTAHYLTKFVGAKLGAASPIVERTKQEMQKQKIIGVVAALIVISIGYGLLAGGHKDETPRYTEIAAQPYRQPTPEEIARREKAAQQAAAAKALNTIKTWELLLDGAEIDLKKGNIGNDMNVYTIGVMLGVISNTAKALQEGWTNRAALSPSDIQHLQSLETKLSSFQQRALPRMRLAFKLRTAEAVWEHDVSLSIGGAGNTVLTLYGFWYATHKNIMDSQGQLEDFTTQLRFKKIRYSSYEGASDGTQYALNTPNDGMIADYTNAGFQKLNRGHAAPTAPGKKASQ